MRIHDEAATTVSPGSAATSAGHVREPGRWTKQQLLIVVFITAVLVVATVIGTWLTTRDSGQHTNSQEVSRNDAKLVLFARTFAAEMSTYTTVDYSGPEKGYQHLCAQSPARPFYGTTASAMLAALQASKAVSTVTNTDHAAIVTAEQTSSTVPVLVPVWVTWTPSGKQSQRVFYTVLITLQQPSNPCIFDIKRL